MKKIIFSFAALVTTICCGYTQDYSTTHTIQRDGYSYQCDINKSNWVMLYNSEDQLTYVPQQVKEGYQLDKSDYTDEIIANSQDGEDKALQIARQIFAEELSVGGEAGRRSAMIIVMIFDETEKVQEVYFKFKPVKPWSLIPIEKYRQVELDIKENITFYAGELGKKANYLQNFILFEP